MRGGHYRINECRDTLEMRGKHYRPPVGRRCFSWAMGLDWPSHFELAVCDSELELELESETKGAHKS